MPEVVKNNLLGAQRRIRHNFSRFESTQLPLSFGKTSSMINTFYKCCLYAWERGREKSSKKLLYGRLWKMKVVCYEALLGSGVFWRLNESVIVNHNKSGLKFVLIWIESIKAILSPPKLLTIKNAPRAHKHHDDVRVS